MEAKELSQFNERKVFNWTNRLEAVVDKGIFTTQAPWNHYFRPFQIANRSGYFTPSVIGEESYISEVVEKELLDLVWDDVFATGPYKEALSKTL